MTFFRDGLGFGPLHVISVGDLSPYIKCSLQTSQARQAPNYILIKNVILSFTLEVSVQARMHLFET